MTATQRDHDHPIPDTIVFDLDESRKGYRLNKMCDSLTSEANRTAYRADEPAYLAAHGLTDEEKRIILVRDWAALNAMGGNIYYLMKLAFVVGQGLYRMGAQMRGQSYEDFLTTRHGKGAR